MNDDAVHLRLEGNRLIIEVPIQIVPMIVRARLDSLSTTLPPLTPRERQVFEGLLSAETNKEIAQRVHMSERTVKFHVSHLLEKFGVKTRGELQQMFHG